MPQPYEIRENREIAAGPDMVVRELTFGPGEATPWHKHSAMIDRRYGLAGELTVECEGDPTVVLRPGEACETPAGVRHRLVNRSAVEARALLVQFGGRSDFLTD